MSDDPVPRTAEPDADDVFSSGAAEESFDALFSGLDDARLGSGIPQTQRLSEDDFVNLSGITRPKVELATPEPAEAPLVVQQTIQLDETAYVSFAEPGIQDVDPDESELLMAEETPREATAEPVPERAQQVERHHGPEVLEALTEEEEELQSAAETQEPDFDIEHLEEVDTPQWVLDTPVETTPAPAESHAQEVEPEAREESAALESASELSTHSIAESEVPHHPVVEIADAPDTFESLLQEPEPVKPGGLGPRVNLAEAEKLLQELSSQPREFPAAGAALDPVVSAEPKPEQAPDPAPESLPEPEPEPEALPEPEPLPEPAALIEPGPPPEDEHVEVEFDDAAPDTPPEVHDPLPPLPVEPLEQFVSLPVEEPTTDPEAFIEEVAAALEVEEPVTNPDPLPVSPSIITTTVSSVSVAAVKLPEPAPEPAREPVMARLMEQPSARQDPPPPIIPSIVAPPEEPPVTQEAPQAPTRPDPLPERARLLTPHTPAPRRTDPDHDHDHEGTPTRRHSSRHDRRRKRMATRAAAVLMLAALALLGYVIYLEYVAPTMRNPEQTYAEAQRLMARQQYAEASLLLEQFARQAPEHPNRPEAQFEAALAMRLTPAAGGDAARGNAVRAVGLLEQFMRDNPAHKHLPRARSMLGILYHETGETQKAIAQLRDLAQDLDDPLAALPVLRALARSYGKSNALHEAEATYLQAAALPKNYTPDHDYFELGELFALRAETEADAAAREQYLDQATHYFQLAMESPGLDPDTRNSIEQRMMVLGRAAEPVVAMQQEPTPPTATATMEPVEGVESPTEPAIEAAPAPTPPYEPDPALEAHQLKQGAPQP